MNGTDCWLQTFTGKAFYVLNPRPEDICVEDIAHALSLLTRFGGHTKVFYSVAEHSVRVSYQVPPEHALWGLLHDASEAFMVDLPRPLKHSDMGTAYRKAEARLMRAICKRFGLTEQEPACVKHADNVLLNTEQRDLMGPQVLPWQASDVAEALPGKIMPVAPRIAEIMFLRRFDELVWQRDAEEALCAKH